MSACCHHREKNCDCYYKTRCQCAVFLGSALLDLLTCLLCLKFDIHNPSLTEDLTDGFSVFEIHVYTHTRTHTYVFMYFYVCIMLSHDSSCVTCYVDVLCHLCSLTYYVTCVGII